MGKLTDKKKVALLDIAKKKTQRHFSPRTTMKQMYSRSSDLVVIGSWGAEQFVGLSDYALHFKVNGAVHKGHVLITLNWMDLYNITLLDKKLNEVHEESDVYAEDLVDVLDILIETPA